MQVNDDVERLQYHRHLEAYMVAKIRPHLLGLQGSEAGLPPHLQKVGYWLASQFLEHSNTLQGSAKVVRIVFKYWMPVKCSHVPAGAADDG